MEGLRPGWAVEAIIVIVISSVLFRCVSATSNHSVGGSTGWNLASDLPVWAAATEFHAGDNLVFKYGPTYDVLEVSEADFTNCQTISPLKAFNDGDTVVPLEKGETTRYFICGRSSHCASGVKLEVKVLLPLASSPDHPPPNGTASGANNTSPGAGDEPDRRHHHHRPPSPSRPTPPSPPSPKPRQSPPPHHHHDHGDDKGNAPPLAPAESHSGGVSLTKFGTNAAAAAGFIILGSWFAVISLYGAPNRRLT